MNGVFIIKNIFLDLSLSVATKFHDFASYIIQNVGITWLLQICKHTDGSL